MISKFEKKVRLDSMRELESIRSARSRIADEMARLRAEDEQLSAREQEPLLVLGAFGVDPDEPEPEPRRKRAPRTIYRRVTLEQVRDWVQKQKGVFAAKDIANALGCSPGAAQHHLRALVHMNPPIIGWTGRSRYHYIDPHENTTGPKVHPRGEPSIAPTEARSKGEAVPKTGKPVGRSGKPGLDKRRSKRGGRVKGMNA